MFQCSKCGATSLDRCTCNQKPKAERHDEATLPKWARERLEALRRDVERLGREKAAMQLGNDVLRGREWFGISGPTASEGPMAERKLWYLNADHPIPACTLHAGDVLLVGRARPKDPDDE